jgi:FKBP-type peptidyl-prolyl cis-trans isomerase
MRRFAMLTASFLAPALAGCSPGGDGPAEPPAEPPAELVIIELAAGEGPEIAAGSTAVVHYTGWLFDSAAADRKGAKFDSSVDRGQPFRFPLGAGRVIRGWDQGVAGMQVGQKRTLIIPPDLGYGSRGAGGVIPPNATLVFDVELLGIE